MGVEIIPKSNYFVDCMKSEQYLVLDVDYMAEDEIELSSLFYEEW